MTNDELDKLKEVAEQATQGPWAASTSSCGTVTYEGDGIIAKTNAHGDAAYISAVSSDLMLKLIEEVKRLIPMEQLLIKECGTDFLKEYFDGKKYESRTELRAQLAEALGVIKTISVQGRLKGYPTGVEWIELEAIARAYLEKYK